MYQNFLNQNLHSSVGCAVFQNAILCSVSYMAQNGVTNDKKHKKILFSQVLCIFGRILPLIPGPGVTVHILPALKWIPSMFMFSLVQVIRRVNKSLAEELVASKSIFLVEENIWQSGSGRSGVDATKGKKTQRTVATVIMDWCFSASCVLMLTVWCLES